MDNVINYLNTNFENSLEELKEYLRIPSISTSSEHSKDMVKCAEFLANKLRNIGLTNVEVFSTEKHPIVYGQWVGAPDKPTVLIYGHYDVQPVDPVEKWSFPPFEPKIENGKLWGRGANDNKGQQFAHIKSVEAFFKNYGAPPVNVKFLIEGEEEIGSGSLSKFIMKHKELLSCDAILISDTSMYAPGVPTITYGLRGLLYMEVELTGPKADLHSGSFGGAVVNPINELAKIISKLHDKNGRVTVPNFYKDVMKLSEAEKENFKRLKFSDAKFARELGVKTLYGEKGFTTLERLWVRPTLDCNGIVGGFTGEGAKTIIPSRASAKISMRLVANQNPKKIAADFTGYIKSLAHEGVKVNVKMIHYGYPVVVPLEDPTVQIAAKAVSKAFGKKAVFTREGGSIPIVVEFMNHLKAPAILMGLGLDTDNIHSPNEHLVLDNLKNGMIASAYFLKDFSELKG